MDEKKVEETRVEVGSPTLDEQRVLSDVEVKKLNRKIGKLSTGMPLFTSHVPSSFRPEAHALAMSLLPIHADGQRKHHKRCYHEY